jgi:hypothetical protein
VAYTDHVGDIMKVTAAFTYPNGQVEEFGIHYQCAAAGTGDTRSALTAYMDSGVGVYLVPTFPATVLYYGSECSTIKALAAYGPVVSYQNTPGTGGAGFPPTQVRGLISWKTQYAGRAYRGRTYLPTPSIANVTTMGKPQPALLTTYSGLATYLQGTVTSGGTSWIPGIYHRIPTAGISSIFDRFTAALVGSGFATQRRSGDYGRVNGPPF